METGVAARFAEVLGAQQRVERLDDLVDFLRALQDRVSRFVETGAMRRLEFHQITRQLGLGQIQRQRAASELGAARYRLAESWGSSAPQFTEVVGDLERLPRAPDLDTLIQLAQNSPTIERWDLELARSEAALRLAKAGRIPDISLGAGVRWQEGKDDRDYLFDLEIVLPIFDTNRGAILEAQHSMARARAGRRAAEAEVSADIADAYYQLTAHEADGETLGQDVVPAARAAFDAFQVGYDGGMASLDDLLDARRDLSSAEIDLCNALVDYRRSLAELGRLVGQSLLP